MARNDTDIVAALAADEVQVFNAVEIRLDKKNLRFWTGYGERSFGDAIDASEMQIDDYYEIATVGTSSFNLTGASSNTVGEQFQATDIATGTGTLYKVYTGTGTLMSVGGFAETSDLSTPEITLTFNGIASDMVSVALQEPYQRRECVVYFGVGNDPYYVTETFSGEMDTLNIVDSGESSAIELVVTNRLVKLERANVRRYTSENHKSRYPTDTFFDTVSSIQDTTIVWGRKA